MEVVKDGYGGGDVVGYGVVGYDVFLEGLVVGGLVVEVVFGEEGFDGGYGGVFLGEDVFDEDGDYVWGDGDGFFVSVV